MTQTDPLPSQNKLSERLSVTERRLQIEVETRDRETADPYLQLAHLRSQVEELVGALAAGMSEPINGSHVSPDHNGQEIGRGATPGLLRIMGGTGKTLRRSLVDELVRSAAGTRVPDGHLRIRGARA